MLSVSLFYLGYQLHEMGLSTHIQLHTPYSLNVVSSPGHLMVSGASQTYQVSGEVRCTFAVHPAFHHTQGSNPWVDYPVQNFTPSGDSLCGTSSPHHITTFDSTTGC